MPFNRKHLNISLILLSLLLGGVAIWLGGHTPKASEVPAEAPAATVLPDTTSLNTTEADGGGICNPPAPSAAAIAPPEEKPQSFRDIDPKELVSVPSLRKEALIVLNNNLEETDAQSRRKILSYCEHFRTAYTTKDIDFLRQVFSDNALIIVGNVIRTGDKWRGTGTPVVSYAIRSKREYLERLDRIFKTNKSVNADFSDFHIMRHPSVEGIYGVTLRQQYSTDSYSDDGYLFLLWDFSNPSMPLIHVRAWQPRQAVADGEEIIDISDFNLD